MYREIIKQINELTAELNVHPLLAPLGTPLPLITYRRDSVQINESKNRYQNSGSMTLTYLVADSSYSGSMNTASQLIDKLINKKYKNIKEITLVDSSEDFIEEDNIFLQQLQIKITWEI